MQKRTIVAAAMILAVASAAAQTTKADEAPAIRVGSMIFADWTYVRSPETEDTAGNRIHQSAFNITRAYLNVTGNLNRRITFRLTPDVTRDNGSGSLTFRLKYAYGQYSLDDFTTDGSWVRFGLQQTPWIEFADSAYRYRFQGPIFADREGFLSSSDFGLSGRWSFPGDLGDLHAGFYNGETYARAETNDQKAFMIRGAVRPLPHAGIARGLRVAGFYDADHYFAEAKRQRLIAAVFLEHPRVNAAVEYLRAKDRPSATDATTDAEGYSAWVTPKLANGWELLFRHDELKPDTDTDQKRTRNIAGIAYWVPNLNKVTAALLLDYDSLRQSGYSPDRADETRYGLKMLINF